MLEAGLRRLRLRGVGSEFESLREYEPGDAYRSIDWKATARRGQPMVTQYDVERSQNVVLALDAGRLMTPRIGVLRKFDYALTAALSTARVAQMAGDNVGVTAFAARTLRSVAPGRGAGRYDALVRAVYDVQPRLEEPDYERAIAELAQANTKRSLIVLFTDLFDPSAASVLLASLRVLLPRHLVLCALMNDAAIGATLREAPRTAHDAFRSAVAMQLEDERAAAVATLRARGIIVVDVPAQRLTTGVAGRVSRREGYAPHYEVVAQQDRGAAAERQADRYREALRREEALDRAGDDEQRCDAQQQRWRHAPAMRHSGAQRVDAAQARPGIRMPCAISRPAPPAIWMQVSSITPCGAIVAQKSRPKPFAANSAPSAPSIRPLLRIAHRVTMPNVMPPANAMAATWMLLVMIWAEMAGANVRSKPKFESCRLLRTTGISLAGTSAYALRGCAATAMYATAVAMTNSAAHVRMALRERRTSAGKVSEKNAVTRDQPPRAADA